VFNTNRSESTPAHPTAALTAGDVLRILRRRVRPLLVTLALVSGATATGALLLPDLYRSETLILVVPQRVPESYVRATVTAKIEDRLLSITHQILSRTRLERIIQDFDLYAAARRTGVMETIVEDMRRDITVKVVKGDAFRVSYVGDEPRTVMQVTERLASLFIEENLRDREELAEGTNRFLEAQLADARRRLIDHEKKLQEYRSRFAGELPSQLPSTLQIIQNVQLQMQSVFESVNRDRDRRLLIERQLRQAENEAERPSSTLAASYGADGRAPAPSPSTLQLAGSRTALADLEARYTPAHPEVQRQRRIVRELETAAAAEVPAAPEGPAITSANAELARQQRVAELGAELEQLDRQLAFKEGENSRLRAAADMYQQRVERVPAREAELSELTRDYSTLQTLYQTLLAKHEESKIAADLERRQIGDQFKVLDPPRIAERPFGPRRWLIDLAGIAGGLVLGLAVVALLEYRNPTVRPRPDLRKFWVRGLDLSRSEPHSAPNIHQTSNDEKEVAACRPSFSN
jgi:polysaccharide chain length determinant protein (PEP-CTERM system associated)